MLGWHFSSWCSIRTSEGISTCLKGGTNLLRYLPWGQGAGTNLVAATSCSGQGWALEVLLVLVPKGRRCQWVLPTAYPRKEVRRTGAHLAGNFNQISDLELVFGFTNAIRESNCINHNHIILPIIKFPLTQLFTLPLLIN